MKIRRSLLSIGAVTAFGLGWTVIASANLESEAAQEATEDQIIPAARPTPPATRPLDPSGTAERVRDPAAVRHPREVPVVRADPSHFIQNARQMLDQEVVNELGQHLGTVEDLVIDVNTGQVTFVAVGPEPRLRPVPPQALRPRPDEGLLILDTEIDRWEEAPAIERDQIVRLARDRDARRIYRYYDQDYSAAVAELEQRGARDETYGAPARWQERHRTELDRLPGDPAIPRAEPRALPPDRTEVHPDLRWEREFGTPHERGVVRERPAMERRRETEELDVGEDPREQAGPALRNPRMHHSHRGRHRLPHAAQPRSPEFGEPPARRDPAARRAAVPHAERLQWASNLVGQQASSRAGDPVGEVADLIVDLNRGQVQHVVIAYERPERQLYAIPLADVEIDRQGTVFVRPDAETLQKRARPYDPREARLQPHRPYRYEEPREFGLPEREDEEAPSRL